MFFGTIITIKSHHFVYTFITLLAATCCSRQVNKRQATANAVALLPTVGNVVLEKNVQDICQAGLNWSASWMQPMATACSLATPG